MPSVAAVVVVVAVAVVHAVVWSLSPGAPSFPSLSCLDIKWRVMMISPLLLSPEGCFYPMCVMWASDALSRSVPKNTAFWDMRNVRGAFM